jgi:hypothetical protein
MADSVIIPGRYYYSWRQEELKGIPGEEEYGGKYGVLFIKGDKTKLFHFRDKQGNANDDVVLGVREIPDPQMKNFCEVEFNGNATIFYIKIEDRHEVWEVGDMFEKYSITFANEKLVIDQSVTSHTEEKFVKKPLFNTKRIDNPYLNEDD